MFDDMLSTIVDMSWLLSTTINSAFDLAVETAKIHALSDLILSTVYTVYTSLSTSVHVVYTL